MYDKKKKSFRPIKTRTLLNCLDTRLTLLVYYSVSRGETKIRNFTGLKSSLIMRRTLIFFPAAHVRNSCRLLERSKSYFLQGIRKYKLKACFKQLIPCSRGRIQIHVWNTDIQYI